MPYAEATFALNCHNVVECLFTVKPWENSDSNLEESHLRELHWPVRPSSRDVGRPTRWHEWWQVDPSRDMERARREASYSYLNVLNVFTAHRSETLFTGEERFERFLQGFSSLCHFFPLLHHQRSPKKFTNTYEPLTSSPFRLTANSHPLNGTCHGSACPLTKDNCDLDKHWGGET